MEKKLMDWAKKVVNVYNPMGVYFYTQSNLLQLHQHPEVLILGINPGSEGSLLEVDRTPEDFLKGNPYFSKDVKWPLWSRLNSIFEAGGISHLLKDDQLFVWSNMFHCDTKHSQELGKYSLNEEHIALTKELINVLQPKFIVCLGTQDCFAKLISLYQKKSNQKKSKSLLPGVVDYFLVDEKIPVYGIYHTSCRYTREKKVLLGKVLGALYRGEVVPDSEALRNLFMTEIKAFEDRAKAPKIHKMDSETFGMLSKALSRYEHFDKNWHYLTSDIIFRLAPNYVNVRHKIFDVNHNYLSAKQYPYAQELITLLASYGFELNKESKGTSLGQKRYEKYQVINNDSMPLAQYIIEELHKLQEEITSLFNKK